MASSENGTLARNAVQTNKTHRLSASALPPVVVALRAGIAPTSRHGARVEISLAGGFNSRTSRLAQLNPHLGPSEFHPLTLRTVSRTL